MNYERVFEELEKEERIEEESSREEIIDEFEDDIIDSCDEREYLSNSIDN